VVRKSINDLLQQAEVLDALGCGPEAVLVTHVGAVAGDRAEGRRL
jgi:UV DNA damage endonuclease